jgi:gamma-glutamylcyclotransferase
MDSENVWYFAYGSNLSMSQMLARVGEWQTSRKAVLKGWKLIFNVNSGRWGNGAANIVETKNQGDVVYGAIYSIKKEKLSVLTTYEHVSPKDVTVESIDGEEITAKTYVFRKDKDECEPPKAYSKTITDGLLQHGYDEETISKVFQNSSSKQT